MGRGALPWDPGQTSVSPKKPYPGSCLRMDMVCSGNNPSLGPKQLSITQEPVNTTLFYELQHLTIPVKPKESIRNEGRNSDLESRVIVQSENKRLQLEKKRKDTGFHFKMIINF